MAIKDTLVIKISKTTAFRVKSFNKGNSYDENIIAFLDYFERTGLNPWSLKEHPIELTMKGFDRTIAALKSIEKNNLKKFIEIEKVLKPLADWVQNGFSNNAGNKITIGDNEDQILEEELQNLVYLNQNMTSKIKELEEEVRSKNAEIHELLHSYSVNESTKINTINNRVAELTNRLEESVKKNHFGSDYSIKSSDLAFIMQSLKNINLV